MDLRELVERNDEEETVVDENNLINLEFLTEAETDAIQDALKYISAACINSKHCIADVDVDEDGENEYIVLDCEDSDHGTTQGLVQELIEYSDYDYDLGSGQRDGDKLFIVAEINEED